MNGQVRYKIRHTTRYEYSDMVTIAHNEARLAPRDGPNQEAHSARFVVEPTPSFMVRERDYFGNWVSLLALEEAHTAFSLTSHSEVTVRAPEMPLLAQTMPWEQAQAVQLDPGRDADYDALQYAFASPHVRWDQAVRDYGAQSFSPGRPLMQALVELTERIYADFAYEPGVTTIATPVEEIFSARRGVCQDFAHLQIACLRALGLCARYVSGYLMTQPPPGVPKLVGADATHAWLSVYCPGHGFVDLDPTNHTVVGVDHTTLAWGRDFADVSPLKGVVLGGGQHTVRVAVDVTPITT